MKKLVVTLVAISALALPALASADTCVQSGGTFSALDYTFGRVTSYEKVAQKFDISGTCALTDIKVAGARDSGGGTLSPAAVISVYSDSSGSPGSVIETSTGQNWSNRRGIEGSQVKTFAFTSTLTTGTYFIVYELASGSPSDSAFYWSAQSGITGVYKLKTYESGVWTQQTDISAYNYFVVSGVYTPIPPPLTATTTPAEIQASTLLVFSSIVVFFMSIMIALWIFRLLA